MKITQIYFYIKCLAVFGTMLSVYLLWQQFYHPAFQPCTINSFINCNAVISGPVAKTLGIPTPLFGLIGYIIIFIAATIQNKKLLISMATFGLVFCLYLAFRELVQLRVICPVCIGCQVDMIAVFILGVIVLKDKKKSA